MASVWRPRSKPSGHGVFKVNSSVSALTNCSRPEATGGRTTDRHSCSRRRRSVASTRWPRVARIPLTRSTTPGAGGRAVSSAPAPFVVTGYGAPPACDGPTQGAVAPQAVLSGALRRAGGTNRTRPDDPETRAQCGARRPVSATAHHSPTEQARRTRHRGAAGAADLQVLPRDACGPRVAYTGAELRSSKGYGANFWMRRLPASAT